MIFSAARSNLKKFFFVFATLLLASQSVFSSESGSGGVMGFLGSLTGSGSNSSATGNQITGFLGSALNRATGFAKERLDWTRQLVPFANFIFFLPQNLMKSLHENDYGSKKFVIENKSADGDEQKDYGIEIDLGFKGSGDVNQPFGFILHNGKFYFRSTKVNFIPEKFYLKNEDGTVKEVKRTDIREYPFSILIPTLLRQFFQEKGVEAWNFVRRIMSPYPQDVAMIKIVSLVAAAFNNSRIGKGYPRVAHVPLELSILFSRLAKTPDIAKTQKLYPAGTKSNQWDPNNIIFMDDGPSEFLNGLPNILVDLINQIQFPVYEGELQEFEDMKGKGLTEAQELYGDMRMIVNYNTRTEFAMERLLPFVEQQKDLTATDAHLLMYAVKIHALERLDSLNSYLLARVTAVSDFGGDLIDMSGSLGEDSLDSARGQLADLDSEKLREVMTPQYSQLKELLEKAQEVFSKRAVRATDVNFLAGQVAGLDGELEQIIFAVDQLSKSIVAGSDDDFKSSYKGLSSEIEELIKVKNDTSKTVATGQKISLQLIEYLNLRYFQFEKLNYKKFDGDVGYFKDDSSMDTVESVSYAMAVVLRCMKDLLKAEDLFKNDTEGQYMVSPSGERELIRGKLIYQDYHEKPMYFKQKVEEQADDLKRQVESQANLLTMAAQSVGLEAQEVQMQEKIDKAEGYYESLNGTYMHYLRQFRFDRRDLSGSFAGRSFNPRDLGAAVKTEEEVLREDLDKNARDWINEYKLFGGSAAVRLDAIIYRKKLEFIISEMTDKTDLLKQEGAVAEQRNLIIKYQEDLSKLNSIKADLEAKIAGAQQEAGPAPEQEVYKDQLEAVIKAIDKRELDVEAANSQINLIEDSKAQTTHEVALYEDGVNTLERIIKNYSLEAQSLDDILYAENETASQLKEKVKDTLISDREFLMTAARVRELINSGEAANFAAGMQSSSQSAPIDTDLIKAVLTSMEKGLAIPAADSLVGEKLDASILQADQIIKKVFIGELDFRGLELECVQKMVKGQGPALLKSATGFFASLARGLFFALHQVYSGPLGVGLEGYLTNTIIPKLAKSDLGEQEPEPETDSIDALIEQHGVVGEASVTNAEISQAVEQFSAELDKAVSNNSVWDTKMWENNVLTKPKKLPMTPSYRKDVFLAAVQSLLAAKKTEFGLSQETYNRIYALVKALEEMIEDLDSDQAQTLKKLEGWCSKIAAATDDVGIQAYKNIKELWKWLGVVMPYIFAYQKYVNEVGTRSSVNEFLAREFAAILTRAKGFDKVARLYLDPVLIRSLGVDTKTLIEASQEERLTMLEQNVALYSSQITGLEAATVEGLESLEDDIYAKLEGLEASALELVEEKGYDLAELELELAKTALAASSSDMQFMLSTGDFDAYFNEIGVEGVDFGSVEIVDGSGAILESDVVSDTGQSSEVSELEALNVQASGDQTQTNSTSLSSVDTNVPTTTTLTEPAPIIQPTATTPETEFVPVATVR